MATCTLLRKELNAIPGPIYSGRAPISTKPGPEGPLKPEALRFPRGAASSGAPQEVSGGQVGGIIAFFLARFADSFCIVSWEKFVVFVLEAALYSR
ncbi:hypothetical protein NL676_038894 [Syzygium grande]|nr:hypothetical protein NL676_038894 [Syzygium grande]